MSAMQDPPRWLVADDEIAARLRPALRRARGEGPNPAEHERMWGSLAAKLPLAAFNGGEATAPAPAARSGDATATASAANANATAANATATATNATATAAKAAATAASATAELWRLVGTGVLAAAVGFGAAKLTIPWSEPAERGSAAAESEVVAPRSSTPDAVVAAQPTAPGRGPEPAAVVEAATASSEQQSAASDPRALTANRSERAAQGLERGARALAPRQPTATPAKPAATDLAAALEPTASSEQLSTAGRRSAARAAGALRPKHGARAPTPRQTTATAAQRAAAPGDLAAELDLLARARRVVSESPARALQLTAEHARRFQDGVLAQEREVLAIDALSRLGQRDLAAMRARRFVERYPNSAHRVRLDSVLQAQ
jgi:hypothetical protein